MQKFITECSNLGPVLEAGEYCLCVYVTFQKISQDYCKVSVIYLRATCRVGISEIIIDNRALTFDFQQCGILTSVDSDEPLQPPFQLRNPK